MRLDVFLTRNDIQTGGTDALAGASCVVIDVLRASTTLIRAVSSGAGPIHIVGDPGEAFDLREKLGKNVLLCGERCGLIVPGFDIGNSPLDYTPETVGGRELIFASTNGSKTLLSCESADEVLVGGFVNLPAIVGELAHAEKAALVCSGKFGRFSIEDAVCAGMIIDHLSAAGLKIELISDSAWTSVWLFERYISAPEEILERAEHPVYLAYELGLGEDVAYCTAVGTFNIVPRFSKGIVSL